LQNLYRVADAAKSAETHTTDKYSNASGPERHPWASVNAWPAPTTLTDRPGTSSHRGAPPRCTQSSL